MQPEFDFERSQARPWMDLSGGEGPGPGGRVAGASGPEPGPEGTKGMGLISERRQELLETMLEFAKPRYSGLGICWRQYYSETCQAECSLRASTRLGPST